MCCSEHRAEAGATVGMGRHTRAVSTAPLPEKAADTSAEQAWPVRVLSMKIAVYVDKMSALWVEGQVV